MPSKYYMTPEKFMGALTDALRETYYSGNEWLIPHHPQDIAMNAASLAEGIAEFMASLIYMEPTKAQRQAGLDRIIKTVRSMSEHPSSEFNDAYVEIEDD